MRHGSLLRFDRVNILIEYKHLSFILFKKKGGNRFTLSIIFCLDSSIGNYCDFILCIWRQIEFCLFLFHVRVLFKESVLKRDFFMIIFRHR
jgi:hypothetical protein